MDPFPWRLIFENFAKFIWDLFLKLEAIKWDGFKDN